MAATPDETVTGVGRAHDPEAVLSAAEAAHLAARETATSGVRRDRPAGRKAARQPPQRDRGGPRRAPLALAAAVAAAWAAALSYAPVAVVLWLAQLAEGGGSPGAALRIGLAGWLLGHGVPLQTAEGPIGLAPLGLAVLAGWRLMRAGVHTTRGIGARRSGSLSRALGAAAAIGLWYGLFGGLAAVIVSAVGPQVSPVRAGLTLAVFGGSAALVGSARTSDAVGTVAARAPDYLRDGVRTGLVVALLLLGMGAAAAGISIALGGGEASDVLGAYRTGVLGQAGVTLLCLAYAPNAAVWAVAYLVGPGFAVGSDSVVRVTEVSVGGLPALPIFAGLPAGPIGGAGAALIGMPVVASMVGGWLMTRRRARSAAAARTSAVRTSAAHTSGIGTSAAVQAAQRWPALLGAALIAGLVAGVLLGLAAVASSGSLGSDRLAQIGPVGWQVALAATALATLGTVLGAAAARTFAGPPTD
ncbi:MAG TPA: DUF6350 family protein [Pilimelia sp.]|nr:DUF6350 family protein [Pilimelia sp.]